MFRIFMDFLVCQAIEAQRLHHDYNVCTMATTVAYTVYYLGFRSLAGPYDPCL